MARRASRSDAVALVVEKSAEAASLAVFFERSARGVARGGSARTEYDVARDLYGRSVRTSSKIRVRQRSTNRVARFRDLRFPFRKSSRRRCRANARADAPQSRAHRSARRRVPDSSLEFVNHTTMSAMTASFTVAPAHARATASIRRASAKRSGARVVRKSIRAEAVKEKTSTLNTTKSDAVRDDAPSSRSRGRRRALAIARRRATSRRPRRAGYDARRGRRDCFSRDTHTTSVYPWAPVARRVQRARLAPSPRGLRSASTRARRPRARPRVDPAPRARFARRARGRRGRSAGPPPATFRRAPATTNQPRPAEP